jgi:hypothetical protein
VEKLKFIFKKKKQNLKKKKKKKHEEGIKREQIQ